ncbi:unnamed protein product, partial [Timema podura]|nr:unnamed protein product [Timema podura]
HNDLPAAYTSLTDTLPLKVKVPGIQLPQKVILLQSGDPPNREPYARELGRTQITAINSVGEN